MTNNEAIETLKVAKSEIEWGYPMDYQIALDKAIEALEQEPCEDCISRQSAIKAMLKIEQDDVEKYGCSIPEGFDAEPAIEVLNNLPSVTLQPKIGQWIEVVEKIKGLGKTWHYKCSICGNKESGWGEYKYCPSCGSRMEVQE